MHFHIPLNYLLSGKLFSGKFSRKFQNKSRDRRIPALHVRIEDTCWVSGTIGILHTPHSLTHPKSILIPSLSARLISKAAVAMGGRGHPQVLYWHQLVGIGSLRLLTIRTPKKARTVWPGAGGYTCKHQTEFVTGASRESNGRMERCRSDMYAAVIEISKILVFYPPARYVSILLQVSYYRLLCIPQKAHARVRIPTCFCLWIWPWARNSCQ